MVDQKQAGSQSLNACRPCRLTTINTWVILTSGLDFGVLRCVRRVVLLGQEHSRANCQTHQARATQHSQLSHTAHQHAVVSRDLTTPKYSRCFFLSIFLSFFLHSYRHCHQIPIINPNSLEAAIRLCANRYITISSLNIFLPSPILQDLRSLARQCSSFHLYNLGFRNCDSHISWTLFETQIATPKLHHIQRILYLKPNVHSKSQLYL